MEMVIWKATGHLMLCSWWLHHIVAATTAFDNNDGVHRHTLTTTHHHEHTKAGAFIMLAHNVGAWIRHLRRNNRFNSSSAGISRRHLWQFAFVCTTDRDKLNFVLEISRHDTHIGRTHRPLHRPNKNYMKKRWAAANTTRVTTKKKVLFKMS